LDVMQERALFADGVDWEQARTEVRQALDDPKQLRLRLWQLARSAGGPHSGMRRALLPAAGRPDLPTVEETDGEVLVTLPSCVDRDAAAYADAARRALDGRRADRWIVDLRGTGGGSMWPLLAAVAPLLRGDGEIGAFVERSGERTPWVLTGGVVSVGGQARARGAAGRHDGPVAVLTDGATASAGEAVAVAFRGVPDARSYGASTLGFSSGNETMPVAGGAVLTVTTSRFADRTGRVYGGRLDPDVPCEDPLSMARWDS
jgi:carboxyl-terminal processing protease